MKLRKLEEYEERAALYPKRIDDTCKLLSEKIDDASLEIARELAEMCYKEGYKDGYRFADWLHERTR